MRRLAVLLALGLAGCVTQQASPPSPSVCAVGDAMVETQLFFGMNKPRGGFVSARDWDAFVSREVSPRFPEGFSVIDGAGFWRDGATQKTISEKSKVVVRLHEASAEADQAIGAIVEAYKVKFEQEAVLRVDRPVCAKF
jgi:hypothetical protein